MGRRREGGKGLGVLRHRKRGWREGSQHIRARLLKGGAGSKFKLGDQRLIILCYSPCCWGREARTGTMSRGTGTWLCAAWLAMAHRKRTSSGPSCGNLAKGGCNFMIGGHGGRWKHGRHHSAGCRPRRRSVCSQGGCARTACVELGSPELWTCR